MVYLTLLALASLIHAGAWMFAAPSKALAIANRVSNEISRYDRATPQFAMPTMRESVPLRVAFRFLGLGLVLLSILRLNELTS